MNEYKIYNNNTHEVKRVMANSIPQALDILKIAKAERKFWRVVDVKYPFNRNPYSRYNRYAH